MELLRGDAHVKNLLQNGVLKLVKKKSNQLKPKLLLSVLKKLLVHLNLQELLPSNNLRLKMLLLF